MEEINEHIKFINDNIDEFDSKLEKFKTNLKNSMGI